MAALKIYSEGRPTPGFENGISFSDRSLGQRYKLTGKKIADNCVRESF